MAAKKLEVYWAQNGPADLPTALAFTGFGHRLDPWRRLQPSGWRLGVVDFPIGTSSDTVWTPEELAEQLNGYWQQAAGRALLSFSFGGAGSTAAANVLASSAHLLSPQVSVAVAPVQWARAPWRLLQSIPAKSRLQLLRGGVKGAGRLLPSKLLPGGVSSRQFLDMLERYQAWELVDHYLPYLDWIKPPRQTLKKWDSYPWPVHLVGAVNDKVIPSQHMQTDVQPYPNVSYHQVEGSHFVAVDRAAPYINSLLDEVMRS